MSKSLQLEDGHGIIFAPEQVMKATSVRDHAFNTVSFTYAVWQVTSEVPKLKTVEEKQKAIANLKEALKAKSFLVPSCLEKMMNEVAGGPAPDAAASSGGP